jgi:hypothetical protein
MTWLIDVTPCVPCTPTPGLPGVGAGGCVDTGADVEAAAGFEDDTDDVGAADGSGALELRRPIVTWTYPTPSGALGHGILTQLPRFRDTRRAAPRDTWPMTGVTLLGPL